jgi:hypothetical protein
MNSSQEEDKIGLKMKVGLFDLVNVDDRKKIIIDELGDDKGSTSSH